MARINASEIILQERLRVGAILESAEGLKAPKLARELALRSSMDADAARAILANANEESPFLAAMAKESIGLTALGGSSGPMNAKDKRLAEIAENVKSFNKLKGFSK